MLGWGASALAVGSASSDCYDLLTGVVQEG